MRSATCLQLFSLGIRCIFYGIEPSFAGPTHSHALCHRRRLEPGCTGRQILVRAMLGPEHPRASHLQPLHRHGAKPGEAEE